MVEDVAMATAATKTKDEHQAMVKTYRCGDCSEEFICIVSPDDYCPKCGEEIVSVLED